MTHFLLPSNLHWTPTPPLFLIFGTYCKTANSINMINVSLDCMDVSMHNYSIEPMKLSIEGLPMPMVWVKKKLSRSQVCFCDVLYLDCAFDIPSMHFVIAFDVGPDLMGIVWISTDSPVFQVPSIMRWILFSLEILF